MCGPAVIRDESLCADARVHRSRVQHAHHGGLVDVPSARVAQHLEGTHPQADPGSDVVDARQAVGRILSSMKSNLQRPEEAAKETLIATLHKVPTPAI